MSHLVPRAEAKLHAVYAGVAESIAPFLPGWDYRSPGAFFLAGIGLKLVLSAFASARVLWLTLVILLAASRRS